MATDHLSELVAAAIAPYRPLLEIFVDGQITADEFETEFLRAFLSDESTEPLPKPVFDIVDGFFADVDSYVPAGMPTNSGDVSAAELQEKAAALLARATPEGSGSE